MFNMALSLLALIPQLWIFMGDVQPKALWGPEAPLTLQHRHYFSAGPETSSALSCTTSLFSSSFTACTAFLHNKRAGDQFIMCRRCIYKTIAQFVKAMSWRTVYRDIFSWKALYKCYDWSTNSNHNPFFLPFTLISILWQYWRDDYWYLHKIPNTIQWDLW